ncbi:MAG: hypothetical protein DI556_06575 [Rhodovulum sulfidophilum]|uniref:Uncharacterized protein n=1 Tax=Rhodovulum sulfidophilum TaxID=35806 RepID=A0A2W5NEA0_RHOSU|nr:MAG: hypothetical protein DI556_06575 [Rhodovulum sulfidophilum]
MVSIDRGERRPNPGTLRASIATMPMSVVIATRSRPSRSPAPTASSRAKVSPLGKAQTMRPSASGIVLGGTSVPAWTNRPRSYSRRSTAAVTS